jgi:catechol 2,3-dioxygenase-like lactoylglutathione lyase family enzyme
VDELLNITSICSVAVQVRSLDRSLTFYRDLLGLHLAHREGWIAQLRGHGDSGPMMVLLELGERAGHYTGSTGFARVAWQVGAQADLDIAERLLENNGLQFERRREAGADIVDTRDPDWTHVLLVWLDDAQPAGNRLPPRLYAYE